jgi:hypothetical protein
MEYRLQHTPTARLTNGKLIAASATILTLAACGGGGGVETSTPTIGPLLSVDAGTANEALASGKILVASSVASVTADQQTALTIMDANAPNIQLS